MAFLIQKTLVYSIPLMIVALAGAFSERSGIINLALEGIMIFGAFIGALCTRIMLQKGVFAPVIETVKAEGALVATTTTTNWGQMQWFLLIVLCITAVCGAIFSLLLAFAAINLKADQTIGGTALNMLAPAIVLFFIRIIAQQNELLIGNDAATLFMIKKDMVGIPATTNANIFTNIFDGFFDKVYLTTYIAIFLFVILSIIMYKTRFGLRLRACGENPQAADSLGINVTKMRYAGVSISGALAGMGGFIFALTTANGTANGDVAGFGFLALAVMIFGNWTPLTIAGAAFLFGFFKCIAAAYGSLDINGDGRKLLEELSNHPTWGKFLNARFYRLIPYLISLLVLAFTSKKSRAPKAEGIPYDKGAR